MSIDHTKYRAVETLASAELHRFYRQMPHYEFISEFISNSQCGRGRMPCDALANAMWPSWRPSGALSSLKQSNRSASQ